jgi:hypothetical protein
MTIAPILLLIFNRPETTRRIISELRKIKPSILYVAADGPRKNNPGDKTLCRETREVISEIDWVCEVKVLYRNHNLGCGKAVSEGVTWFFSHEKEGIILEDDCLPSRSFFLFCSTLLDKYREETKVMHISGLNWQKGKWWGKGSYYFSVYPGIWGWATWRDRWKKYCYYIDDVDIEKFVSNGELERITANKKEQEYHLNSFKESLVVDTWDYQWKFTVFKNKGICIFPNLNLVSNIGFGLNATHTKNIYSKDANRKKYEMIFPLSHPKELKVHKKADKEMARMKFLGDNSKIQTPQFCKGIIKRLFQ